MTPHPSNNNEQEKCVRCGEEHNFTQGCEWPPVPAYKDKPKAGNTQEMEERVEGKLNDLLCEYLDIVLKNNRLGHIYDLDLEKPLLAFILKESQESYAKGYGEACQEAFKKIGEELNASAKHGVPVAYADGATMAQTVLLSLTPNTKDKGDDK